MKKKILARMLSLAMAATLTMSMGITAFAAENVGGITVGGAQNDADKTGTDYPAYSDGSFDDQKVDKEIVKTTVGVTGKDTDRGQIAVKGLEGEGLTVTAYQIIKANYGADGGLFSNWVDMTGKGLVKESDGTIDNAKFDQDTLAAISADIVAGTLTTESFKLEGDKMANGEYSNMAVKPGSYLVIVSGGETKTYGPMVVSLFYENYHELDSSVLVLVSNKAFAKMQDEPTIKKMIAWNDSIVDGLWGYESVNGSHPNASNSTNGEAVVTGDAELAFDIRVNNIPEYHGANKKFIVTDTMGKGLTLGGEDGKGDVEFAVFYNKEGKYVDDDGNFLADYKKGDFIAFAPTSTYDEATGTTTLVWDFSDRYDDMLLQYAGYDMVIRYTAKVDPEKIDYTNWIGATDNDAKIEFAHNSNVSGDDGENHTPDRNVYTFNMQVLKVDAADTTKKLNGATFTLTTDAGDAEPKMFTAVSGDTNNDGKVDDNDDASKAGVIEFKGLVAGKYVLKETVAPDGYTLDGTEHKVTISAAFKTEGNETVIDPDSVKITIGEGENAAEITADKLYEIKNTNMVDLPATGGMGSALFIAIGAIGLIVGLFVVFGTRRKSED